VLAVERLDRPERLSASLQRPSPLSAALQRAARTLATACAPHRGQQVQVISHREDAMTTPHDHRAHTPDDCPWHPLPDDAIVQLVAIERRPLRHRTGPPILPARVVWGVVIRREAAAHERHDLPLEVFRALARDGGGPIRPMTVIPAPRLNAAVERATRTVDGPAGTPPAQPPRRAPLTG
jgi:hypothetical protein